MFSIGVYSSAIPLIARAGGRSPELSSIRRSAGTTKPTAPIAREIAPAARNQARTPATLAIGAARSRPSGAVATASDPRSEKTRPWKAGSIVAPSSRWISAEAEAEIASGPVCRPRSLEK
jgi:hypothetical protein